MRLQGINIRYPPEISRAVLRMTPSLRAMNYQLRLRPLRALGLLAFTAALCASTAAETQLAIAGFAIGQEMKSCPPPSVPMRKGARDDGIACRFPNGVRNALGTAADQLSMASDPSGKIESIVVMGIDAVQAAAWARKAYGAPDEAEESERLSYWGWQRGDAALVIFYHPKEPAASNVMLNRQPR